MNQGKSAESEHANVFALESDFLEHYRRAMKIARYPQNFTNSFLGEDLLGVPLVDPETGEPVKQLGRVRWISPPKSGWIPDPTDSRAWIRAPFLAHHLQSTLIHSQGDAGHNAIRLTPEVRIQLSGEQRIKVRTLSFETKIAAAITLLPPVVEMFKDRARPLVRMWFALHDDVECSVFSHEPAHHPDGRSETVLIMRFYALHDDPRASMLHGVDS